MAKDSALVTDQAAESWQSKLRPRKHTASQVTKHNNKKINEIGQITAKKRRAKHLENIRDVALIRSMTLDDVKEAVHWAEQEGWNPCKRDLVDLWTSGGKKNFLGLYINDKLIGSIVAITYHNNDEGKRDFGFIGLFIVKEGFRGQGFGRILWTNAMRCLKDIPIGLYAVPKQVPRYKSSGFNEIHKNIRYLGNAPESRILAGGNPRISYVYPTEKSANAGTGLIVSYDRKNFPGDRACFLQALIKNQLNHTFISYDKENTNGVNGFIVIRPLADNSTWRIGPLYADNFNAAKDLVEQVLQAIPGNNFILDTPSMNKYAAMFGEYFNLRVISDIATSTMIKGEMPKEYTEDQGSLNRCYAKASLELG